MVYVCLHLGRPGIYMYALVYEIAVKVDTVRLTSLYIVTPLHRFPATTDYSICMVGAVLSNQSPQTYMFTTNLFVPTADFIVSCPE